MEISSLVDGGKRNWEEVNEERPAVYYFECIWMNGKRKKVHAWYFEKETWRKETVDGFSNGQIFILLCIGIGIFIFIFFSHFFVSLSISSYFNFRFSCTRFYFPTFLSLTRIHTLYCWCDAIVVAFVCIGLSFKLLSLCFPLLPFIFFFLSVTLYSV